jgi:hypothetical protein
VVALSLLGEMRSPHAVERLVNFVWKPLPTTGTEVEGEIVERTALASLEAKAITGLAYMRTPQGDAEVLRAVSQHESIIVRAEAIASYLWNHGNSDATRAELKQAVRPGDEVYLDRMKREPGQSGADFDRELEAFLKAHPERVPPPHPQRTSETKADGGSMKREPGPPPSRVSQ